MSVTKRDLSLGKILTDHGCTSTGGVLGNLLVQGEMANGSEYHKANEHPETTDDQRLATTELFNHIKAEECGTKVNAAEDYARNIAVRNASGLEDRCSIVEEKVGTSELLFVLSAYLPFVLVTIYLLAAFVRVLRSECGAI